MAKTVNRLDVFTSPKADALPGCATPRLHGINQCLLAFKPENKLKSQYLKLLVNATKCSLFLMSNAGKLGERFRPSLVTSGAGLVQALRRPDHPFHHTTSPTSTRPDQKETSTMARSRTLKPDFFDDLTLADCDLGAAFLYAGMWCFLDGQGLIEADVRIHKKNVFPLREDVSMKKIDDWISQLVDAGRLIRLEHNGKKLLFCPTLHRHSRVYADEPKKFNIPNEILNSAETPQSPRILPEVVRIKPAHADIEEAEAEAEAAAKADAHIPRIEPEDFEQVYAQYPKRAGTRKGEGMRSLALQASRWGPDEIDACRLAAANYRTYCELERKEEKFIMQFKTWCGSIEDPKWREWIDWSPQAPKNDVWADFDAKYAEQA